MGRFWGWLWVCLLVVGLSAQARAEDNCFEPIPVCVRPPGVPKYIGAWFYSSGGQTLLHLTMKQFTEKSCGHLNFTYDPEAPPENTGLLPIPFNNLPCDPKPPPPAPPEAAKTKMKEDASKQEALGASRSSGAPTKGEKRNDESQSPPRTQPDAPKPAPEEDARRHPRLPSHGVTKDWPSSVLPKRSVLPTRRRDDPCAWTLPMAGSPPVDRAHVCKRNGNSTVAKANGGDAKTGVEEVVDDLAELTALVNMQFDEELHVTGGKRYGIVGGKNPNGPNSLLLQAGASVVMIAAVVLSPAAEAFEKKLITALAKETPLLMKEMEKVGLDVGEELVKKVTRDVQAKVLKKRGKKIAKDKAEQIARAYLADAMKRNGAIGPYEVMQQFTNKLGGRYQAHHILEVKWVERFELGNIEKVPSVILTEAEHKKMTARLMAKGRDIKDVRALWKMYQDAYKEHPTWLAAIKPFFVKGT